MNKLILCIVVLFSLLGCNARGPVFTAVEPLATEQARIYFYRPAAMIDGAAAPMVFVNGEESFRIKNGGYHVFDVTPGPLSLEVRATKRISNWRAAPLQLSFEPLPGETYFVRLQASVYAADDANNFASVTGSYTLEHVEQAVALTELLTTKQSQK